MKYEITDIKHPQYPNLRRIRALKSFGSVETGDLGGYVQSEENLSHSDRCWVYDNAVVNGYVKVTGDAMIYGNAKVTGKAKISGEAAVYGKAKVSGSEEITGSTHVSNC